VKTGRVLSTVITVVVFAVLSRPASAQDQKVQVCHKAGNGTFHLISIDVNALAAHVSHGDGKPGDPVPGMPGLIFGPNCTPTVAPPPELPIGCYTLVNNPPNIATLDLFYMGPIDTLGNITDFFGSTNGTCSGTGSPDPLDGVIAAANATDALNKCIALTGQSTGSSVIDLGGPMGFLPSEPGFWICSAPPF